MSYEKKWNVLSDFLLELQERGEKIPAEVMKNLHSAKTMIQVLKADPTHTENLSRIDTYLRNVETYVIFTAEKHGTEIVNEWLKKLETEEIRKPREKKKKASTFIPGIPRDKKWVRIQTSEDTPPKEIEKLVEASDLSYKMQKNGHILVYGNDKNIKSFMKKMTERFHGVRNG